MTLLDLVSVEFHYSSCSDSRNENDFANILDTIMEDNLTFGRTSRYIQCINASEATESFAKDWDEAIGLANRVYSNRMHNLCWDNCHSHVKNVLNRIKFRDFNHWNMGILAVWMFFAGKFVRFWYSVLPSLVLYAFILALVYST